MLPIHGAHHCARTFVQSAPGSLRQFAGSKSLLPFLGARTLDTGDINRDGWKDIYVTNDYLSNDLFWINSPVPGEGATGRRFVDKAASYLKHTSYSAMGNDVADLNSDGLADIVALDMQPEDNFRRNFFTLTRYLFIL